jgi:hypothetical protein
MAAEAADLTHPSPEHPRQEEPAPSPTGHLVARMLAEGTGAAAAGTTLRQSRQDRVTGATTQSGEALSPS